MDKLNSVGMDALAKLNQNKLENIKNNKNSTSVELKKAASDFEALLVSQMLKSMWKNVEQTGLSSSREEGIYRDMLNDEMAKDIASGKGFGIKDIIIRELEGKKE